MGVTDGVVRAVAFSKGSVVLCPLHPSPPSRASPVPACTGSGLSRARSNCTHNTRSKSLCRVLRSVPCASPLRVARVPPLPLHPPNARVRSFGEPMPTCSKSLRKCAEHNVSSSTPAPVRVKALYAHRRSHTTIRGPSRAAAHSNFPADARLRVFRIRRFAASDVTHAPVRPSSASTIAPVHVQHGPRTDGTAASSSNSWTSRPQTTCTHGVTWSGAWPGDSS